MVKILISACLVNQNVRHNAKVLGFKHPIITQWQNNNILIPFCPEVEGGLPIPRNPAEIVPPKAVKNHYHDNHHVLDQSGNDRTGEFTLGAQKALRLMRQLDSKMAILKERSPSCGSKIRYDGTFSGTITAGQGLTTVLLNRNGIKVFNEEEIDEAFNYWSQLN